jgi:hypothetical protein
LLLVLARKLVLFSVSTHAISLDRRPAVARHDVLTIIIAESDNLSCLFPPFGVKRVEQGANMKKPKLETEEQQPRKILRADKAPTSGYSLVVDGHFKSHHDTIEAAEAAGLALKNQYQMLQVQVYDAATRTRSMIAWPAPAA